MRPDAQTLLDVLTTSTAALRREARWDSYHHMTGSLSLIREDVEKCTPTRIVNDFGKRMVLHHAGNIQVFDTQTTIALRIVLGGLKEEVAPLATDLEMLYCDRAFLLTAPVTLSHTAITDMLRSGEHTSELQSPVHLVCRLLLEKEKKY